MMMTEVIDTRGSDQFLDANHTQLLVWYC